MSALKLFCSYSHKDDSSRERLETHLTLLKRQRLIGVWHDRRILGGQEWKGQIDSNLETADIVLLLVSADFIASDYCYDIEMTVAMERHEKRQAVVIPVIIRDCDWHSAPFGKLQALPKDGRAVELWNPRSRGWKDVAKGIRQLVKEWPKQREAAEARKAELEREFRDHVIAKHSKLTLYSVTSDHPLSVELEKVFVTLTLRKPVRELAVADLKADDRESAPPKESILDPLEIIRTALGESTRFPPTSRQEEAFKSIASSAPHREQEVTLSVPAALRVHRAVVIVGDAGAGKTTLLKYLALAFARDKAQERLELDEHRVPILVALRDFNVFLNNSISRRQLDVIGTNTFPCFLREFFATIAPNLELPEDFFADLLNSGRAIVLLDGLDEVPDPSDRARMAQLVSDILTITQWRGNRFIVTSRPRGYERESRARLAPHCAECAIRPFDDKAVEQFALAWYQAVTFDRLGETPEARQDAGSRAAALTDTIRAEPRISALAQNPLLLSVLAMVHQRNIQLPRFRARLYEECSDFLLGYWDEHKDCESATQLGQAGGLDRDQKRAVLEPIALWLHECGEHGNEVERADLECKIEEQFFQEGQSRNTARQRARQFLRVIEERSGLLVERSPGVFAFAHLTFQEYLAARALVDREDGLQFTLRHLHDPWWREVVLLQASLLSDVRLGRNNARRRTDQFLQAIRNAGSWRENLLHRDLLLAVRCVGDMDSNGVDEALCRSLTDEAIILWRKTEWKRQRTDVTTAFANSANTSHGQQFIKVMLREAARTTSSNRTMAVQAIGSLGSAAATQPVIDCLIALTKATDSALRTTAVSTLDQLGSAAATLPVIECLLALAVPNMAAAEQHEPNPPAGWFVMRGFDPSPRIAAKLLARLAGANETSDVLDRLLTLSAKPNHNTRRCAIETLRAFAAGGTNSRVAERLLAATADQNLEVRDIAISALGSFSERGATPRVIDRLQALLHDKDDGVRGSAVVAVQDLGSLAARKQVIDELFAIAECGNFAPWETAARALVRMWRAEVTPSIGDRLILLIANPSETVHVPAILALKHLEPALVNPQLLERLLDSVQEHYGSQRDVAEEVLRDWKEAAATPRVFERLRSLTKAESYLVRRAAVRLLGSLGRFGPHHAILDCLMELIRGQEDQLAGHAAMAFGTVAAGNPDATIIASLPRLLRDKNKMVRLAALLTIEKLGPSAGSTRVIRCLLDLTHDAFGVMTVNALGALGKSASIREVFGRLLAVGGGSAEIRAATAKALGRLEAPSDSDQIESLSNLWEPNLSKTEEHNWGQEKESVGDYAYGQLQRLAAQQARFDRSRSSQKISSSRPRRKASALAPTEALKPRR